MFQSVMKSEIDMINSGTENEFTNARDETFSLAANIETKITNFVKNVEKRFQLVVQGFDKQMESFRWVLKKAVSKFITLSNS